MKLAVARRARRRHATAAHWSKQTQPIAAISETTCPLTSLVKSGFGDFLVDRGVLDRYQLLRALQLQDRTGMRIGAAAVALGFVTDDMVETLHGEYARLVV